MRLFMLIIIIIITTWAGFCADASGGGSHGMWGPGGGVGGDVADLEGLGPQGCDERGGAGTLTCGNGAGD